MVIHGVRSPADRLNGKPESRGGCAPLTASSYPAPLSSSHHFLKLAFSHSVVTLHSLLYTKGTCSSRAPWKRGLVQVATSARSWHGRRPAMRGLWDAIL